MEFEGTGRFEVIGRLGSGRMGVVYEVFDRERNARVALKQLRTPSAEALLRFKDEFRALQVPPHPNLVMPDELVEDEGQWLLTMELVRGVDVLAYVRPDTPRASEEDSGIPTLRLRRPWGPDPGARVAGGGFDEDRLRAVLRQLAEAVAALHRAGKVHCDVKPANTCVTEDGRVVLLDFGLVADIDAAPRAPAGSPDYMAPEQLSSGPVAASDWYAVGVLLHEMMTGRLPFEGSPAMVMTAKLEGEAPPLPSGLPDDLVTLCAALLRRDAAARPGEDEVLARLGAATPSAPVAPATPFVGRAAELAQLDAAFRRVRAGGCEAVLVEGESGLGKTALVRHFAWRLGGDATVLAGRCHPRESVPYKALDGIIDAIAAHLGELDRRTVAVLLPPRVALLAQVFPVLRRVEAITRARASTEPPDRRELRAALFAAFRELLRRLGDARPVVLSIDDLQWTDGDSLAMLREALREPDAPRVLVVATIRPDAEPIALDLPVPVRRMALAGMAREDAAALAAELGGGALAGALADEARGHPLFLAELVRHAAAHPSAARAELHLEEALRRRIRELAPEPRRLLEILAVAGGPVPQRVATMAADARDPVTTARWLGELASAHLIRMSGPRTHDPVEPYHDRVRAAVLDVLAPEVARICHRRLAVAYEKEPGADAETRAVHWLGAGEPEVAAGHAFDAAREAFESLAFDRAARLYQLARELRPPEGAARVELGTQLGEALRNAGRGAEAADAYLDAAAVAEPAIALELRGRASAQCLRAGHIERGLEILREVLPSIGLGYPGSPRRALLGLVWQRARLQMRGLGFRARAEQDLDARTIGRVDTCFGAGVGLGMVDTVRGAYFQSLGLRLALDAGEPYRVCRALATEVAFRASAGLSARADTDRLLAASIELGEQIGDPRARGFVRLAASIVGLLEGRFTDCIRDGELAEPVLRDECAGLSWELFNARYYPVIGMLWTGDLKEVGRRLPLLRADADAHGDRFAGKVLRAGLVVLDALARDEPDRGDADARQVQEQLGSAFQFQHYWTALNAAYVELYRGRPAAALTAFEACWEPTRKGMFFRVQYIRAEALWMRARCLVAAGELARAAADARRLAREDASWTHPMAAAIRAAIARASGHGDAAALLAEAEAGFAAHDQRLHALACRRWRGVLRDDAALVAEADAGFAAQGVVSPAKLAAVFVPGFG